MGRLRVSFAVLNDLKSGQQVSSTKRSVHLFHLPRNSFRTEWKIPCGSFLLVRVIRYKYRFCPPSHHPLLEVIPLSLFLSLFLSVFLPFFLSFFLSFFCFSVFLSFCLFVLLFLTGEYIPSTLTPPIFNAEAQEEASAAGHYRAGILPDEAISDRFPITFSIPAEVNPAAPAEKKYFLDELTEEEWMVKNMELGDCWMTYSRSLNASIRRTTRHFYIQIETAPSHGF